MNEALFESKCYSSLSFILRYFSPFLVWDYKTVKAKVEMFLFSHKGYNLGTCTCRCLRCYTHIYVLNVDKSDFMINVLLVFIVLT